MSETEDQVIKELLEEMKALKEQNSTLHKKVHRRNWFSKEMIGIYTVLATGAAAWGNTWLDTYEHREHENQQQSKSVETRRFVDTTLLRYVDGQIEEVYETCDMYLDAVMSAMPSYQRRKVERRLMYPEEAPTSSLSRAPASPPPPIKASASMPEFYQDFLQAAEEGEDIPLKGIIKNRARSLHKKR